MRTERRVRMVIALFVAFVAAAFLVVRTYVWQYERVARDLWSPADDGVPPSAGFGELEIAYLRGGEREVLQATIRAMVARGLLRVDGRNLIHGSLAQDVPRSPLEWSIYDLAATTKRYGELEGALQAAVRSAARPVERALRADGCLMPEGLRPRAAMLAALFMLLSSATAAAMWYAMPHEPQALALYLAAGLAGVAALALAARVPRLTERGRQRLCDAPPLPLAAEPQSSASSEAAAQAAPPVPAEAHTP